MWRHHHFPKLQIPNSPEVLGSWDTRALRCLLVPFGWALTWHLHTKLYKFGCNIFPNNARMILELVYWGWWFLFRTAWQCNFPPLPPSREKPWERGCKPRTKKQVIVHTEIMIAQNLEKRDMIYTQPITVLSYPYDWCHTTLSMSFVINLPRKNEREHMYTVELSQAFTSSHVDITKKTWGSRKRLSERFS